MYTEPELLNERLERLAMVLDEIMPNCALLVRDALELLKEQESDKKDAEYMPMEAVPVTIGNDYRTWLCSACGSKLQYRKELICQKCHRKIDWDWEGR